METVSPGPDDIFPHDLKDTEAIVSKPLASIYTKPLDTKGLPAIQKKSKCCTDIEEGG